MMGKFTLSSDTPTTLKTVTMALFWLTPDPFPRVIPRVRHHPRNGGAGSGPLGAHTSLEGCG